MDTCNQFSKFKFLLNFKNIYLILQKIINNTLNTISFNIPPHVNFLWLLKSMKKVAKLYEFSKRLKKLKFFYKTLQKFKLFYKTFQKFLLNNQLLNTHVWNKR
jgi:hypothetical protein